MSQIPRGTGRKHPNEDAVRDGAAKGSSECRKVIESWEQGTHYKPPASVDEHHHPYFAAIQDGANSGSDLCRSHLSDWGFSSSGMKSSGRKLPHEDAVREAAKLGSKEAKKVCLHWDKGEEYTPPGEEHGRQYYYAISEGAKMGSNMCKEVMSTSWNIRM